MKRRLNPRFVQKARSQARSWRKAARELNALFGVNLHHLAWRDYATGRREIADAATRAALGLGPRPCPRCGHKPGMQITRLLKRLTARDLKRWNQLREGRRYKAANRLLEEVYRRTKRIR